MALNLQYGTAGKVSKTASATTVGLPSGTANVRIHIVNPTTGADVIAPVLVARPAGATTQTVTIPNVPYGNYQVVVESLDAANNALGYFHNIVQLQEASITVTVDTSVMLTALAISPTTATIGAGTTQVFLATGTFSDNTSAPVNPLATWASSATAVAGVAAGTAVGLTAGTTTITVFLSGQSAAATLTVTSVIPQPSPTPTPTGSPTYVGTSVCAGCHNSFPPSNGYHAGDLTNGTTTSFTYMDMAGIGQIPAAYTASVHYTPNGTVTTDYVRCEGCHGPGSLHYGVGPIPYPLPGIAQCGSCHNTTGTDANVAANDTIDMNAFYLTPHANPSGAPDKFFFQGSNGTAQATSHGAVLWKDPAGTMPVTKNERIEECSVCHSPDQKPAHISSGDVQNPPQVACSGCHDVHYPAQITRNTVFTSGAVATVDPHQVPNLKPVQVNDTALPLITDPSFSTQFAALMFGAMNKVSGTWIRPRTYFAYNTLGTGAADTASSFGGVTAGYSQQGVLGNNVRASSERLCASCHAQGKYKYSVASGTPGSTTDVSPTHQNNVFQQFYLSGHYDADLTGGTTTRFSQKATAGGNYRPIYPMDMNGRTGQDVTGAFDGRTAVSGVPQGMGGASTNTTRCFRCHHGVASIDYMNATQWGTAIGDKPGRAHILWADSAKTCITCHDPHESGAGNTKNVRKPVYLSYHDIPVSSTSLNLRPGWGAFTPTNAPHGATVANLRGGVNAFMDLSPIPSDMGNNGVCLMCHQGRESGWTAWNSIRTFRNVTVGDTATAASDFVYTNPDDQIDPTGGGRWATMNDHDLPSGGILWGRNADEIPESFFPNAVNGATNSYDDGIPAHRQKGCVGCHMAGEGSGPSHDQNAVDLTNPSEPMGGHTWGANIITCQECHPGLQNFEDVNTLTDYDGNPATVTLGQTLGALPTASPTASPETTNNMLPTHVNDSPHVDMWTNTAIGGTGLMGLINRALYDGIVVNVSVLKYYDTSAKVATFPTPHRIRIHLELSASGESWKAWAGHDYDYNAADAIPNAKQDYNGYCGITATDGGMKWIASPKIQMIYQTFHQFMSMNEAANVETFVKKAYVHNGIYYAQNLIDILRVLGRYDNPTTSNAFVRPAKSLGGTNHAARDYRDPTVYGGPGL